MNEIVTLNEEQMNVLEALKQGENVFLTGYAGTGKSHLIGEFIRYLQETGKELLVCAPTGVAAVNIGGETIHRLFETPTNSISPSEKLKRRKVINMAEVIIIDEIGMCRFDVFDYIIRMIQASKEKSGKKKQIVVAGDFHQLPPVITQKDREILETLWGKENVKSGYAPSHFKTYCVYQNDRAGHGY